MDAAAIEEKIKTYVVKELMQDRTRPEINRDESLIDRGIIDSLGLFKLIAHIEEEFGIAVDPNEVRSDNFATLALVTDLVQKKLGQKSGGG